MNKRSLVFIFLIVLLALVIINGASLLYVISFVVWSAGILYSSKDFYNRGMLFMFLISFFVFLMGRDFLEELFVYRVESDIPNNVLTHTYITTILSLGTLLLGYRWFSRKNKHVVAEKQTQVERIRNHYVRDISKLLFYISTCFAFISKISIALFVLKNGYKAYYLGYSNYLSNNIFIFLSSKIELMMPVSLCVYLASMPRKKDYFKIVVVYVVYLILTFFSGQRGPLVLGCLLLIVYEIFRQGLTKQYISIRRKHVILFLIGVPLISLALTLYSNKRFGEDSSNLSLLSSVPAFMYDQGVSSNVIKRAYEFKDRIPDQPYIMEFIHGGIFAKILGIEVYHGNSEEHAMKGGSFTHTIGYVVMGKEYLAGRGTGSSYIAELFQCLGYFGIVLGNVLYAFLLSRMLTLNSKTTIFKFSLFLFFTPQLLWAPRASFSGFMSMISAPTVLLAFIIIFGGAHLCKLIKTSND